MNDDLKLLRDVIQQHEIKHGNAGVFVNINGITYEAKVVGETEDSLIVRIKTGQEFHLTVGTAA